MESAADLIDDARRRDLADQRTLDDLDRRTEAGAARNEALKAELGDLEAELAAAEAELAEYRKTDVYEVTRDEYISTLRGPDAATPARKLPTRAAKPSVASVRATPRPRPAGGRRSRDSPLTIDMLRTPKAREVRESPRESPRSSRRASPRDSPRDSPRESPRESPPTLPPAPRGVVDDEEESGSDDGSVEGGEGGV